MDRQAKTAGAAPALKVCGLTTAADVAQCLALAVDYIGFNLYPGSTRFVAPARAAAVLAEATAGRGLGTTRVVAVLVNPTAGAVDEAVAALPEASALQFHGNESAGDVASLAQRVQRAAWKAIGVSSAADVVKGSVFAAACSARYPLSLLLFDAPPRADELGGTGVAFDWGWLDGYTGPLPFGLAGGVRPGVTARLAAVTPRPAVLDVCSGVERAPGIKDPDAVAALTAEVRRFRAARP